MESFLANKKLKLILFGGKGGTGKTTSAAATALYLSKTTAKKILVVSSDPAPSLGDSFGLEIGNKITKLKDNLYAIEFDAKELLEDFRKKNARIIKMLLERGTYLGGEDLDVFKDLAIPGMDEVMAILKIADYLKIKDYDLIILDTAPTGHTKVLLSLPAAMEKWLKVMNLMQEKHRFLMKHWSGRYVKDEGDKFLEETKRDIAGVKNLLGDADLTEFVPVTIAEPISILETEDLIKYIEKLGIRIKNIIVNRFLFGGECEFCQQRTELQEGYAKTVESKFSRFKILKMPLFPREIREEESLLEYAKILFTEKKYEPKGFFTKNRFKFRPLPEASMAGLLGKDLNLIICGGKGGVGKSTIAGALAIALAESKKDKKILITTTDPAHALSKVFEQSIILDTKATPIKGFNNLFALEIDAEKMFSEWKQEYRQDVETAFREFVGEGADIVFDQKALEELMELAPPGLEELMALNKILDFMNERTYDIYVLDSAASGHLLRFLELPGLIRDWLRAIFQILLKYKNVVGLVGIKEKLLDFSKNVRTIQGKLFGSRATEFIMISIAEEMGFRIMKKLAEHLQELNLAYNYIILNMIYPASKCKFCLAKRENQEKYVSRVKKEYPKKKVVLAPLFPYDLRGPKRLQELSRFLFG